MFLFFLSLSLNILLTFVKPSSGELSCGCRTRCEECDYVFSNSQILGPRPLLFFIWCSAPVQIVALAGREKGVGYDGSRSDVSPGAGYKLPPDKNTLNRNPKTPLSPLHWSISPTPLRTFVSLLTPDRSTFLPPQLLLQLPSTLTDGPLDNNALLFQFPSRYLSRPF